jgi:hypothetical protein
MAVGAIGYRQAYSHWLRTGRWVRAYGPDGRELKFNPYHDPRNGQFTFAPGGPRSLSRIIVSDRQGKRSWTEGLPRNEAENREQTQSDPAPGGADQPTEQTRVQLAGRSRGPSMPRGGNARAFQDPMTLDQAFPGLRTAPGGAIVATIDTFFDFRGPARSLIMSMSEDLSRAVIRDIRSLIPTYRSEGGVPSTLDGHLNELNRLRFDRAVAYYRVRGDTRPLQVEALRFAQARTDSAYEAGLRLLQLGKLPVRLSREEALGNYIDRRVREELRSRFNVVGIDWAGNGPVRVNKRENDSSPSEQVFRRPDFRIDRVAFDVTLTMKTIRSKQVRGFFSTDFRPTSTVIIRPSQLGENHTYAIRNPEAADGL